MSKPAAPICSSRLKSTVALNAALAYTSYCRLLPRLLRTRRVGRRLRQRTIEPIFGSLLQHYGLRRVNTRGGRSAHKTMLLTAITFNLKKPLKHQPTKTRCLAIAQPVPPLKGQSLRCWRGRYHYHNRLANGKQE